MCAVGGFQSGILMDRDLLATLLFFSVGCHHRINHIVCFAVDELMRNPAIARNK